MLAGVPADGKSEATLPDKTGSHVELYVRDTLTSFVPARLVLKCLKLAGGSAGVRGSCDLLPVLCIGPTMANSAKSAQWCVCGLSGQKMKMAGPKGHPALPALGCCSLRPHYRWRGR